MKEKKNKPVNWTVFICILFFSYGCSSAQSKQYIPETTKTESGFRLPDIPVDMTTPDMKLEYLVLHYWDHFPYPDTSYAKSDNTEQIFADFVEILSHANEKVQKGGIWNMLSKAEINETGKNRFRELCEKYFYNPNSPMRNDIYFRAALEQITASVNSSEAELVRYGSLLKIINKNQPGSVAPDFMYLTSKGKIGYLNQLAAERTLLFFYDPDCPNCREIKNYLANSSQINDLSQKGLLKILAVYPDDNIKEWESHLKEMPSEWIVSRNPNSTIEEKGLYELRALPTIYLLDKNKKIILKDADIKDIIEELNRNAKS